MDFNDSVSERCNQIKEVLSSKAKEYAADDNRFENFDVAARMQDITPEQALWGMAMKHIVSVQDIVNSPKDRSKALVSEKIGDAINYLILLEGLLERRRASEIPWRLKPSNINLEDIAIERDSDGKFVSAKSLKGGK